MDLRSAPVVRRGSIATMLHDCAMAVLVDGDRVLLCHRHPERSWMPDVWDFPGGHLGPGESARQALVRELAEELDVDVPVPPGAPDELLVWEEHATRIAVWFLRYAGPIENRAPAEHDDIQWMTRDEAANVPLADPSYLRLIERALLR